MGPNRASETPGKPQVTGGDRKEQRGKYTRAREPGLESALHKPNREASFSEFKGKFRHLWGRQDK